MSLRRTERQALAQLPTAVHRWEIELLDLPITIQGVETEGMLLVVEEGTGNVRSAGPVVRGESLWPVLGQALLSPSPPCSPARPHTLLCTRQNLAARLLHELKGVDVRVQRVERLPHVDEAVAALASFASPLRAPGITVDRPRWAAALSLLCEVAPWSELPDRLAFRFEGDVPELASGVAVVLGLAGEQQGVVLYRSNEDFERFQALALARAPDAAAHIEAMCLYIDPVDELDPSEREEVRCAGLELPGRRAPRLVVLREGGGSAPTERQQRVLLAAIEALVRLCATDLRRLRTEPCSCTVSTGLGRLIIRCTPALAPPAAAGRPLASDVAHAVIFTRVRIDHEERPAEEIPAVVVKMGKRDAQKLAARISRTDAVVIEPRAGGGVRIRLFDNTREIGVLCEAPVEPALARQLGAAPTLAIGISGGGPKRPRLRSEDLVVSLRVAVRAAGVTTERRHDAIFDKPPEEWPKISDTLVRFAQGALGSALGSFEPEALTAALQMASTVWNGVVLADFAGKPEPLDEVRRRIRREPSGPGALIEALITQKRQQFPGDPRLISEVRVERRGGEPRIFANASLPAGYRAGSGH